MNVGDGLARMDGAACTHADSCTSGLCKGILPPTCGEKATACEPTNDNGSAQTATLVGLVDGEATVLGQVSPAAEIDWYAVEPLLRPEPSGARRAP